MFFIKLLLKMNDIIVGLQHGDEGKGKLYHNTDLVKFDTFEEMREYIETILDDKISIRFSSEYYNL